MLTGLLMGLLLGTLLGWQAHKGYLRGLYKTYKKLHRKIFKGG